MKPVWRMVLIIFVVMIMGFAVITSSNNGSSVGDALKKSAIIERVEESFTKTVRKAIPEYRVN